MSLDIDALLKATAQEVWDEEEPSDGHLDAVWLSLAVIVPAVTAEVRALHHAAYRDGDRTPICPDCHGKAGTHPCGCWREYDVLPVCAECGSQPTPFEADDWPCPTARLLDELDATARGERS